MGNDPKQSTSSGQKKGGAQHFKISAEPQIASRMTASAPVEAIPDIPVAEPALSSPKNGTNYDQLGELPPTYQTGQVYLAARDPHWLFVYWDLDLESFDRTLMIEDEATFYLKVFTTNGELTDQIRVNTQAKNWYFPIKDAGIPYYVELGFNDAKAKWAIVGTSNITFAPPDTFSDGAVEFASVPFHLSFQQLMEMVQTNLESGDSLVGSLSHLQGDTSKNLQEMAGQWSGEQKTLLESLLGTDLVSQISLGSAETNQIFRKRLAEVLSESLNSANGSELSFLQDVVGASWNESSLFSGVGANFSGESSWSGGAGIVGGESSWLAGLGGESSWSGALGSSWSAQPFGAVGRDFFMHVNAEVIFYGGTHPDATVWVDGKEIKLAADGSFRYHFRLPDGEFEIPIVAESPDGVEVRSAKLVFQRGTSRQGEVGATSQPGYLHPPMGAKM